MRQRASGITGMPRRKNAGVGIPRQRGFVLGFYATSLAAGFAVGPLILGFTGTAGMAPFMAAMALFVLAGGVRAAPSPTSE